MKRKIDIMPRMLTKEEALTYISRSDDYVKERLKMWEDMGFPFPGKHPLTGNYDVRLIDKWLDESWRGEASASTIADRTQQGRGV